MVNRLWSDYNQGIKGTTSKHTTPTPMSNLTINPTALSSLHILDEFSQDHLYVWRLDRQITPQPTGWMIEIVYPGGREPLVVQVQCFDVSIDDAIARLGNHFDLSGCDVNHCQPVMSDF